jgi:hypothetical protein
VKKTNEIMPEIANQIGMANKAPTSSEGKIRNLITIKGKVIRARHPRIKIKVGFSWLKKGIAKRI